jgi:Ca2+-binding RTX toxin-like protein
VDDRFINIEAVIGTDFNDKFFGYTGNERLDGGKGDDTLMGGDGNDYLIGGEGNDSLVGGEGADTLDGGAGDNSYDVDSADTRINTSGMGKQTVQANDSYALTKSAKIDVLKAGSTAGSINLTGNAFDNDMIGNAGRNTLKGDGGDDKIAGGAGRDVLVGGKGRDAFIFDTKLGADNLDTVLDYNPKTDVIWLDNGIFTKLGTRGSVTKPAHLKKAFFTIGDKAKDANDYIIYDKATGSLSYDADGSGSRTAIEFAKLKPNLALTSKDIFVI